MEEVVSSNLTRPNSAPLRSSNKMSAQKVQLAGSQRRPVGTRVGDQPNHEIIEVSVILKPKARAILPRSGGAAVSREEFAAKHGADPKTINQVKQFAKQN